MTAYLTNNELIISRKFHQLKDCEGWSKLSMRHALKIINSMEINPINVNMKSSLN